MTEGEHYYNYKCVGRKFSIREFPEIHEEYYNRLKKAMLNRINVTFSDDNGVNDPLTGGRFWARTYIGRNLTLLYETLDYSNHAKTEQDMKYMVIPQSYFKEENGRLTMKEGNVRTIFHSDIYWDGK